MVDRGEVLVVEDDAVARELLCATLGEERFRVRSAGDVEGALALLAGRLPHVVITDLHLADGMGGVELARRLRSAAATSEVRIVAISGAVEPDWPVVRHFDAYLRKPLDVALLVDVVGRLSARPGRPRSARSGRRTGA